MPLPAMRIRQCRLTKRDAANGCDSGFRFSDETDETDEKSQEMAELRLFLAFLLLDSFWVHQHSITRCLQSSRSGRYPAR